MTSLIILLIIAGVCGSIGRALGGGSRGGCLVSIALGFIGAIVGMWLARALDLPKVFVGTSTDFPIVWSIIGSALFVAVLRFISGRNA
ncbi:MAG TPA: GlsB/YeaQ/YmgE family stress response membrane protein [Blastocatellia bacterium]|nr:GlsB/YeaQ/YmgE family stress response membrane protein [Blastocatellia bacterium]